MKSFANRVARVAFDSGPITGNDGQIDRRSDGRVYFRPKSGRLNGCGVSIHDADLSTGHVRRLAIESPNATHRIFLQPDHSQWRYPFAKGERRELTTAALERQIQGAAYKEATHAQRYPKPRTK